MPYDSKKWVYICHKYRDDPVNNSIAVLDICKQIDTNLYVPIAPQIYLNMFIDEDSQRDLAMDICLNLLSRCDVLLICGPIISIGMKQEIQLAHGLGIPVINGGINGLKERTTKSISETGTPGEPPRCVHKECEECASGACGCH